MLPNLCLKQTYNMGLFNKEVELIIPPKKQNANNKTINVNPLNGYDVIREKMNSENTLSVKSQVQESTKPKTKVSIGS